RRYSGIDRPGTSDQPWRGDGYRGLHVARAGRGTAATADQLLTSPGTVVGTIAYMSPLLRLGLVGNHPKGGCECPGCARTYPTPSGTANTIWRFYPEAAAEGPVWESGAFGGVLDPHLWRRGGPPLRKIKYLMHLTCLPP